MLSNDDELNSFDNILPFVKHVYRHEAEGKHVSSAGFYFMNIYFYIFCIFAFIYLYYMHLGMLSRRM